MVVFSPHPLITAHPIDIHVGTFSTPPRLLQPPPLIANPLPAYCNPSPRLLHTPRLFTLRLFSNPSLIATPVLFRTGE